MKEKTIEELEKELEDLRESNKGAWEMWGSELCSGDMERQEEALIDKISELKLGYPKDIQTLKLEDNLLLQLIGGEGKPVTVRVGRRDIKLGQLLFIGARDQTIRYVVEVVEIRYLKAYDIGEDVIEAEGFKNWTEFYEDIKRFYPDLELTDECTVIYYQTADVKTQK